MPPFPSPAVQKIGQASDPFEVLCQDNQLTEEGCAWLKTALDPFHDYEIPHLSGYPDLNSDSSLVYEIKQEITIDNSDLPAGNWDCHIAAVPLAFAPAGVSSCKHIVNGGQGTGTMRYGGTWPAGHGDRVDGTAIWKAASGSQTFNPAETAADWQLQNLSIDDFIAQDANSDLAQMRVIAVGFEVVNTTATLHQQGAVTCYKYSNNPSKRNVRMVSNVSGFAPDSSANAYPSSSAEIFRAPPQTVAQAKALTGSRTWQAKEGAYVVPTLCTENNDPQPVTNGPYIITSNLGLLGFDSMADKGLTVAMVAGAVVDNDTQLQPALFTPFSTSGAYFTGLSEETSLTVTMRMYVERFPGLADLALASLAEPSSAFDPLAIELYSRLQRTLPPAVPVNYNSFGKWFKMIANTAKDEIKSTLPKVLPKAGAAIGAAMGGPSGEIIGERAGEALVKMANKKTKGRKKAVQNFGKP